MKYSCDVLDFRYFFFGFCVERSPPIDEVIKEGAVPRFVEFLGRHDMPQLQVRNIFKVCY